MRKISPVLRAFSDAKNDRVLPRSHHHFLYAKKYDFFSLNVSKRVRNLLSFMTAFLSSFHNEEPSVISNGLCRLSFQNETASLNHKLIRNKSKISHYEMTGIFSCRTDSHPAGTENDTHCEMTDRHSHKERSPCQSRSSSQIFVTRFIKSQLAYEIFLYQNYFFFLSRF